MCGDNAEHHPSNKVSPFMASCPCPRFGSDCTALVVATGAGTLGLYVMCGEGAGPLWAESTPQCITEGVELRAVRSQVGTPLGNGWAGPYLSRTGLLECCCALAVCGSTLKELQG